MDELKADLKRLIIEVLDLQDVTPDRIADDQPLFRDGLGLDSIDALELTVAIEQRYRVSIADERQGRQVLTSIDTLSAFISRQGQGA